MLQGSLNIKGHICPLSIRENRKEFPTDNSLIRIDPFSKYKYPKIPLTI